MMVEECTVRGLTVELADDSLVRHLLPRHVDRRSITRS